MRAEPLGPLRRCCYLAVPTPAVAELQESEGFSKCADGVCSFLLLSALPMHRFVSFTLTCLYENQSKVHLGKPLLNKLDTLVRVAYRAAFLLKSWILVPEFNNMLNPGSGREPRGNPANFFFFL